MRITCPHCDFKKEIEAEQIPANVVRVTCPACRQTFLLSESISTETESEADAANAVAPHIETAFATATDHPEAPPLASTCAEADEPATILARAAALLVDTVLIVIMILILRIGLSFISSGLQLEGVIVLQFTFLLFALTLGFAYHLLFIAACGQTPGKKLLRIRVMPIDRPEMTYSRALLRELFGRIVSAPLLLGYLLALFHPQRRAVHDKIADTCVVKYRPAAPRD
ncbi:MAG: zinc-ribbon domain-containing protein [Desulfuromonadales bacterium]|nr:zinc-ribbon domain-containing protein [Desulfuromonadales bacterium]